MDNHVIIFVLCVLWILPYSAAFTDDCCHVTWTAEARHVTCSGCGLQDVPKDLPINITELNLRNNSLYILHRKSFFNLVALKRLSLSMNKLSAISPGAFDDLRNLEYLDLSDNNLNLSSFVLSNFRILNERNRTSLFKELHNLSFVDISSNYLKGLNSKIFNDQKESLTTLVLAKNTIERLPTELLQNLTVLETLDVSNNLISTLRESEYTQLDALKTKSEKFKVRLSGNPFVCSCDNLDFISWIETTQVIYNKDELMCVIPGGSQLKIRHFLETFDQFQDSCVSQFWLIVSIVLFVFLFMLGILSRESWRRSVWLRVKCRHPLKHDKYPYDIFISHCGVDLRWVAKTFVPWLDEKGIRYCIEEKDFGPGTLILENIMDAIDNSHQTVFVISCASLKHGWQTFTMKLASFYSFRDRRQNSIIVILLDNTKISEFPKLMRKNRGGVRPLRWPNGSNMDQGKRVKAEKLFWKKLSKLIQRENMSFPSANESSV